MKDLRTKHGGTLSLSRSRRRCQEAGCSSPFGSHRVLIRTEKVFFSPERSVSMSRCYFYYYHGNLPKCRFYSLSFAFTETSPRTRPTTRKKHVFIQATGQFHTAVSTMTTVEQKQFHTHCQGKSNKRRFETHEERRT